MAETAQVEANAETSSQAPVRDKTPIYEVGFHIIPTVGDDGIGAVVERVRKAVGDVEIIAEGAPQKMALAYTIERATAGKREKYSETYFGWIKFALGADAAKNDTIPALEAKLLAMKEVLRSLIIQTVREDIAAERRRAVFTSDRLEGQTLEAPKRVVEKGGEVSEEELEKSIEALTG